MASHQLVTPPRYVAPRASVDIGQTFAPPPIPRVRPRPPSTHPARQTPQPAAAGGVAATPAAPRTVRPPASSPSRARRPAPGVIGAVPAGPATRPPSSARPDRATARSDRARPDRATAGRSAGPPLTPAVIAPALIGGAQTRPGHGVNAVGGVIGAALPRTAAPASGTVRHPEPSGGSRHAFRTPDGHLVSISDRAAIRGRADADRDEPWATGDGVAPVLEPARDDARHEPGPAIGLHSPQ
jgi:hypothetical protein